MQVLDTLALMIYSVYMNPIQRQLLELADTIDLGSVSYYRLSKTLGINHPYKVKFALDQLEKNGLIIKNYSTGKITKVNDKTKFSGLISIPYYGEVNCGVALSLADDVIQGYLRVSPSVIKHGNLSKLFALKAVGDSMNMARISGDNVDNGDYIIAEKIDRYQVDNGDYIISIIQGAANLKRIIIDKVEKRVLLFSESSRDYPPIVISELDADDESSYMPIARAVEIIKGVRL